MASDTAPLDPDDPETAAAIKIARHRRFTITGLIAVPALLFAFYGTRYAKQHGLLAHREPPPWAEPVGLALCIVGLLVGLASLVAFQRSPVRRQHGAQVSLIPFSQRRSLLKQIKRNALHPDTDLSLARAMAAIVMEERWLARMHAGITLSQAGVALIIFSVFQSAIAAAFAIIFVAQTVMSARYIEYGEAFLLAHPEPDPEEV